MKKGFTLVELIVVIVLLSLISIFTFPSINKTLNERKEKLYNIQIENIKTSTKNYINKNNLFSASDKVIVTLCQLKQEGFTDENIKDPRTGVLLSNDSKVIAEKDTNEYTFILGDDNSTTCGLKDDTLFEYVEVGSAYIEKMDESKYTITIYLDNNEVESIDTSRINTYIIKYTSADGTKITKYVYIIDTTGPEITYTKDQKYVDANGNEVTSKKIGEGTIIINANQNDTFIPFPAQAIDKNDGETELNISSNVNLKLPGTYYITYSSTDQKGNTTTKNQKIEVVDTIAPIIDNIFGIPENKTSNSIVLSVDAYDNESGLHPRGAYSFDGGSTWQVNNTINVDENKTINIVVRDAALNETRKTITIDNILKDDKNLSFTITKGTMKNSGWFIDDVEIEIKPLVAKENFKSYSYCISSDVNCTPNKEITEINGTLESITTNTKGLHICGYVTKNDGTKTAQICSMVIKIDKEKPLCTVEYETNYDSSIGLPGKIIVTDSISGPEQAEISFLERSSKVFEVYDKAGNQNTCTVKVKASVQSRYKTCNSYNSCPNEAYCGRSWYYCDCSDCKYGANTCRGGYTREVCTQYGWCHNTGCSSSNKCPVGASCWCEATKKTGWDPCKYGSNTCQYGCDECDGGANSCPNPTCGCSSWTYSEWTSGECTNVSGKTCETRREYLKGE